jgi:hypothetical protein
MKRPLTRHLEEARGTKEDWDLAEKLMTDKEFTNKLFPLTEEEAFKRNEADQQVRENLSYYIELADRYYQEGEKLRGEKKILESLKEDAETRATIWREKYENLKREMENVADFFAKYERRVI